MTTLIEVIVIAVIVVGIYYGWRWAKPKPTTAPAGAPATSQPKGLGWGLVIGFIVFGLLVGCITYGWAKQDKAEALQQQQATLRAEKAPVYEWSWELPPGQSVHNGVNKSGPIIVEIIPCDDGALWVNVPYMEYGHSEQSRLRLAKIGEKSWEGPWEQDNPKDSGRCSLHETSPGVWSGNITGVEGKTAFCKLVRK